MGGLRVNPERELERGHLPRHMKALRKNLACSQKTLGELLCARVRKIAYWEAGDKNPDPLTLELIIQFCEATRGQDFDFLRLVRRSLKGGRIREARALLLTRAVEVAR